MEMWTAWLIIAGFFFILEMATTGFLVFWFGIGAVATMGISFLTDNMLIQTFTFVSVSIILILLTRKLTDKINSKEVPTNVYTILGKKATVSQTIDISKSQGQIKIDGDLWSAKPDEDEIIEEGSVVEILRIDGVKAVVKKI